MKVATYEAVVVNGQIKFSEPVQLPERAKVYVVVTGVEEAPRFHVTSPRLVQPGLTSDSAKEVTEEPDNAWRRKNSGRALNLENVRDPCRNTVSTEFEAYE